MHDAFQDLPDNTRVWVYQSDRPFPEAAIPAVLSDLRNFAQSWVSHDNRLRAFADVWHERFVILMVDEGMAAASGCSIDSSVRFLKSLQAQHDVDLFDRMRFSYREGDAVVTVPREVFAEKYAAGEINDDTLVFDTLVKNKAELQSAWEKPLGQSWHKRMVRARQ